jgi:hypothetical protein
MRDFRIPPLGKYVKTALFWVITQRVVVSSYRHFRTNYRSPLRRSYDPEERSTVPHFVNFPVMLNYFVVMRCKTADVLACVGQVLLRLALGL